MYITVPDNLRGGESSCRVIEMAGRECAGEMKWDGMGWGGVGGGMAWGAVV